MWVGRLEHSRAVLKVGYLPLFKIPVRLLTFDQAGLLGHDSPANSEELVKSIMNALKEGEAELALLHQIRTDSSTYQKAICLPSFASRDRFIAPMAHNVMKLPGSIDDVYRSLSGGHRSELRRKKKKILGDFDASVKVSCIREPAELDKAVAEIEKIAAQSYQRSLGVGFQNTEQMRQRLLLCARQGWLRIYLLSLGGKPCAFWLGTLYGGIFNSDFLAFDTQFGDYSPGMFLLMEMVDGFCREGVKEIDFGSGEGRYKERFGNFQSMEASVHIYAPTLKGWVLNTARTATGLVDRAIRKMLQRTNLMPGIKKFWRLRLTKQAASAVASGAR